MSLGDRFNRPIDELPKTLETLCFGADFDQSSSVERGRGSVELVERELVWGMCGAD